MINASSQSVERALVERSRPQLIRRIGVRTFWTMLALEVVLLFAALAWVLGLFVPAHMPIAGTADLQVVRDAVWERLAGAVNDPLVEVQPGISVRESNLRGFSINGEVYYYYVVGNQNFDPLSRGKVRADQIEVVLRDDDGPLPLVIYRLLPQS